MASKCLSFSAGTTATITGDQINFHMFPRSKWLCNKAWAHIESEQESQYKNSDKYIQNWQTNTVLLSSSPWPLEFGWEVVVFYVCCHLFSQWCCLPPPAQTCWALWIITISIARFFIQVIKIQIHLHKEYTCLEKWARAFLSSVMGHSQLKGTQPALWQ